MHTKGRMTRLQTETTLAVLGNHRRYVVKISPSSRKLETSMKYSFYVLLICTVLGTISGCGSNGDGDSGPIDVYGGSTDVADIPKHIADFKDESNSGLVQGRAMNALVAIGKPAVEPLIQALGSEDVNTRLMALNTLNLIGSNAKTAIPTVEKLTSDPDSDVKARAIDVLANLKQQ